MAIAHAPGVGVFSDYQYLRRCGRSAQSETWLVQKKEGSQHAVKMMAGGAELPDYSRLAVHRHPFLMSWDRCEIDGGDLLLLRYWSEETLADYLQSPGQARQEELNRAILLRHLEETAEVLDFLHKKAQIVHGSLKASNIGLLHNHVKLLDWGLVTSEHLRAQSWSLADLIWVAPEQVRGELLPQSDQYALACIFVNAMTGKPPRSVSSLAEYFQSALKEDPPELLELSAEDRQVAHRALQRDPAARYKTCQEFVHALAQNPQTARLEPRLSSERIVIPEVKTRSSPAIIVSNSNDTKQPIELLDSKPPSEPEIPTSVIKSFVKTEGKTGERHPDSSFLNLNSLVYHSEVTNCGVLTPSLVIGLGGHGVAVLQQLAEGLQTRFGSLGDLPNLRLLAIDTDASSLGELGNSKPGTIGKEQTYHARLATPGGYLWKDLGFPDAAKAIPDEQLDRLGPEPKTNQLRSLGRLAFTASYSSLRERITTDCKAVLQSRALMEATAKTGLPVHQDITPTVYLIAALGGATGGGAIIDLAYLVRSSLSDLGWSQIRVTALAFLPADSDENWVKANAFASIVEMNHFTEESFFSAQYPPSSSPYQGGGEHFHMPNRPFDEVFFWRLPSASAAEEIKAVERKSAHWLLRDLTTTLGSLRRASRELVGSENQVQDTPWRSHGFAALAATHGVLHDRGRRSILSHFALRLLQPPQEILDEIQKDAEKFLVDNHFTLETTLARLEHVAAIVLGREPAELIDEWVSPLRKGAAARPPLEAIAGELLQKVEFYFGQGEGNRPAPAILAMQHEAETAAQEICARIPLVVKRYLERPGYRIGASLVLARLLLQWVTEGLVELQENHKTIEQEMVRAERTLTGMVSPEERGFTSRGRQRQATQVAQDLMDFPVWVIREDMFARAIFVFQKVKDTLISWVEQLEPAEKSLQELQRSYQDEAENANSASSVSSWILDGQKNLTARINQLCEELPEDAYTKLDLDFSQCLMRYQASFTDNCLGKGQGFRDLLELLTPSLDELMEEILPPEDAAEQLLRSPSQALVEQLREAYRSARPLVTQRGSRQGAFCLMITPPTDSAKELLQMAQSTLPQIIAAAEGATDEVFLYRETGPLKAAALYPQGKEAYQLLAGSHETSPHSRTDITSWQPLSRTQERGEGSEGKDQADSSSLAPEPFVGQTVHA